MAARCLPVYGLAVLGGHLRQAAQPKSAVVRTPNLARYPTSGRDARPLHDRAGASALNSLTRSLDSTGEGGHDGA
jgi:hypothetical protein